ncbi:MAG: hypothetical protein KAU49_01380 [Candidatus Krumholzibacteria bacterium]|nr:hypothetical protein [Candidatus Krumholzibacteria bacterium]
MCRKPLFFSSVFILTVVMILPSGGANAQCFGSLSITPGFFEFDYLVRLSVHFGSAEDIPADIICSRGRMPGEEIIEFPLWFYNVHGGVNYLYFGVESNDTIVGFTPGSCVTIYNESFSMDNGIFQYNLKLSTCQPLCGPGLAGHVLVKPAEGSEMTWLNLATNKVTGRMIATDEYNNVHHMFSPHHGGYVGSSYLYTCQEPICEEPNLPVIALDATAGYGLAVKLTWISGEGNTTVIRARSDSYFPTGPGDGRLVVEMPGSPGMHQYFYDTAAPQGMIIYYKAFSLTKDTSGQVINNSFVECAAMDTTFTHGFIATEESSWGAIKKKMMK